MSREGTPVDNRCRSTLEYPEHVSLVPPGTTIGPPRPSERSRRGGGEGLGGGEKKGGEDGSQKARREYSGGVKGVEGREEERVSSETSRGRYPVSTAN